MSIGSLWDPPLHVHNQLPQKSKAFMPSWVLVLFAVEKKASQGPVVRRTLTDLLCYALSLCRRAEAPVVSELKLAEKSSGGQLRRPSSGVLGSLGRFRRAVCCLSSRLGVNTLQQNRTEPSTPTSAASVQRVFNVSLIILSFLR